MDPSFLWPAIAISLVAAAMITLGLGRVAGARSVVAIGLLAMAGAAAFDRWVVAAGAVAVVAAARAMIGGWATFALACVVAGVGSIASLEHAHARGVLAGAALGLAGWAIDRFALPMVAVPGWHGAACVVVLGVLPFRDAVPTSVIATSTFAFVIGWLWWGMRARVDRALFGRPAMRASILAALLASVVMIAFGHDASAVMMFATIATLLPFFAND